MNLKLLALVVTVLSSPIDVNAMLIGYGGGATPRGLYNVSEATGARTFVTAVECCLSSGALARMENQFFATNYYASTNTSQDPISYGVIDIQSGEFTPVGQQFSGWYGLTANSAGGFFYVVGDDRILRRVIPGGAIELIGTGLSEDGSLDIRGMAYDRSTGLLYATNYYSGVPNLYSIDTLTGRASLIGSLGLGAAEYGGDIPITFDAASGTLYAAAALQLYTVDVQTGFATAIGAIGAPLSSLAWYPDVPGVSVPEPGTFVLFLTGLGFTFLTGLVCRHKYA